MGVAPLHSGRFYVYEIRRLYRVVEAGLGESRYPLLKYKIFWRLSRIETGGWVALCFIFNRNARVFEGFTARIFLPPPFFFFTS